MDAVTIAIAVLLLAAAWYVWYRTKVTGKAQWEAQEQRPQILRQSKLRFSEQRMRCNRPVPLSGRIDQAYELPDHSLVLVDTKTRQWAKVYFSDTIQLSVYAVILRAQGWTVQPTAYVRHVWNGRVQYLRVSLLPTEAIVEMYHHRGRLFNNPGMASLARYPALCRTCGQREAGHCEGR